MADKQLSEVKLGEQASKIFTNFRDYNQSQNFKVDYSSTKFFNELQKYDGITKIKKRDAKYYDVNISILKTYLIEKYNYEFEVNDFIDDDEPVIKKESKKESKKLVKVDLIKDEDIISDDEQSKQKIRLSKFQTNGKVIYTVNDIEVTEKEYLKSEKKKFKY